MNNNSITTTAMKHIFKKKYYSIVFVECNHTDQHYLPGI